MDIGLTKKDLLRVMWTAVFAFLGVFLPLILGLGGLKSAGDAKAAALALLPAAIAAGFSALKNGLLSDANPVK